MIFFHSQKIFYYWINYINYIFNFESIYQGNKFFKYIALSNFVFYSIFNSTSILLIFIGYMNVNQLILISILIKFIVIVFMLISIIFKKLIKENKKR